MSEINQSRFDKIQVPTELDAVIQSGIRRAVPKVKTRYYGGIAMKITSTVAAVLLTFVIGLNASPAFGKAVTERMPFLSGLIMATKYDKGLDGALKNGFVHQTKAEYTDKGISLVVQDVIADGEQLTFSYKIAVKEGYEGYTNILPEKFIANYSGKESDMSYSYVDPKQFEKTKSMEGIAQLEWDYDVENIPDSVTITCTRMMEDSSYFSKWMTNENNGQKRETDFYKKYQRLPYFVDGKWTLTLNLKEMKKLTPKIYKNIQAESGSYKFNIESVEIYPTVAKIKVTDLTGQEAFEKRESLWAYLEDENGEKYQAKSFGVYKGRVNATLNSPYFSQPKELYLVILDDNSPEPNPIKLRIY